MLLTTAVAFINLFSCSFASEEVNVYSARKEALIKPLLDRFTKKTGVKVNLVTGKGDALLTRLKSEGKNSPADLLITTDVGRLYRAHQAKVLQNISSSVLEAQIPQAYREKEGYWYGLSQRSRVIVYAKNKIKPEQLTTYESLSDEKWKGQICIRSSGNIYNQSLIASFIQHQGLKQTETWLKAFVKNFARPPQGGDRDQIKAVAAGQCNLAVVNTYYLGAMLKSDKAEQKNAAAAVGLFWPNQQDRGAHVNISGAGVTTSAPNKKNAIKLLEFLASDESQAWYAEVNNEYPVNPKVKVSDLLTSWGNFKADKIAVEKLGELNAQAVMAMDRAGWK